METISLNKKIYRLAAIEKTIAEFKELAKIKIVDQGEYFVIEFQNVDKEYQGIIKDEFANYALGLLS